MQNNVQCAREYVAKAIACDRTWDEKQSNQLKLTLLKKLIEIFAEEFKVDKNKIHYVINNYDDSCSIFETKRGKQGDEYYINIDERYLKKSTIKGFVATITHEYGHLLQTELERRGKKEISGFNMKTALVRS